MACCNAKERTGKSRAQQSPAICSPASDETVRAGSRPAVGSEAVDLSTPVARKHRPQLSPGCVTGAQLKCLNAAPENHRQLAELI